MSINPMAAALLADLRQAQGFLELLKALETPRLPRFKASQAQEAEKARATWIYESGRLDQHERWLAFLTGKHGETSSE
jgi:hypothetical protein